MKGTAIRDLLIAEGVDVLDKGHGVAKGNFNIKCPMCGIADPSYHMGINLTNGWWGCWRNSEHRGKSPVRLLVAALGKPVYEVRRLLGLRDGPDLDTFGGVRDRLSARDDVQPRERMKSLRFPPSIRVMDQHDVAADRFYAYVRGRGFPAWHVERAVRMFSMHYAVSGEYKDRVVLPFYYRNNLVTWTGRSIHSDQRLRYRDLEKEASTLYKNDVLYNYDRAALGGRALIVLEGPFDVVKGDYAGEPVGVHCVGLGTNSMSDAQLVQLIDLADAFEYVFISMDAPTEFAKLDSVRMVARIRGAVDARPLPGLETLGKDIGGAPLRAVSDLFRRVVNDAL